MHQANRRPWTMSRRAGTEGALEKELSKWSTREHVFRKSVIGCLAGSVG